MFEERRAPIEAHLDSLKELRKAYLSHYRFLEGNASEEYLSSILEDVHQLEVEIMEVRKQLPPPMSQRQLRALEEIPKAWAEVTGKKIGDEYHTKESWAEWQQRNIVDPELIDKIRQVAFKEAPVTDLLEHAGAMLTGDWYSPEVATAYANAKKQAEQAYQEMLDKAHEEALEENLRRDLWARFDKPKEEALCKAADKTLQEYADIAAGRAEPADVADYEEFPVELHYSANGDKRFEGAFPDDPATKQRKSLGRAIIDLLNTKYK